MSVGKSIPHDSGLGHVTGESIFIETFDKKRGNPIQPEIRNQKSEIVLRGLWQVNFLKGEPSIPQGFKTEKLDSWTKLSADTMAQYFSGTACYTLNFNALDNQIGKTGWLELGDVRESAVVKLNGKVLGTTWSLPYRVPITEGVIQKGNNKLEIEVTNLSANRIRYMDIKAIPWRKFYDINIVDINYRPFDASGWLPVASGLLGDVRLITF